MTDRMRAFCVCSILVTAAFWAGQVSAFNNGDVGVNTVASAQRMIEDLRKSFGGDYVRGAEFARRLDAIEAKGAGAKAELEQLIREASLANPLLDFDRIVVIRRTREANRNLNSHTSETIKRTGWDNEISELSNLRGEVKVRTVYRHANESVMKHMDVHFSGERPSRQERDRSAFAYRSDVRQEVSTALQAQRQGLG